ncbi:hypothetical protein FRE64_11045 [Euhalothece natronophila Z-M001]|uniref:DNA helicase n=1 Tax=Euhalothece natronophila Z-M001 TaxID=522448 RepID=A0A5B8NMZ1_9CHRO|nr:hypothetical protein [Euhalothece natronophila]QDZ40444.1 hypothetical protein FRE64_11045 [Euhalothece natronophila Z-M001]
MFIYRTESFQKKLQLHNLEQEVDRLCEELAQMSVSQAQSRFERIYPFLKRKERNLRLIARIYRVDNTPILCWLTLFHRGASEYKDFLRDRENYAHQSWAKEVEESRLREWLKQQQIATSNNTTTSPRFPSHLYPWLQPPTWEIDTNTLLIYESQSWVQQFQNLTIRQNWQNYYQLIVDLIDMTTLPGLFYPDWEVRLHGNQQCHLLYTYLITQDESPREILFLLYPFLNRPTDEEIAQIIQKEQFNFTQEIYLDDLTNWAQRSYTHEIIYSEESWLAIEDETTTNLALSAEEEAILHSVSTSYPSLPLFLNGQAGSGKSTMLFHLFADYCHRHFLICQEDEKAVFKKPHPLFLAYNDRLLKVAKEQVATLLQNHHRFTEKEPFSNPLPQISPFFKSFRQFLRNLLPPEEKQLFSTDKYISFHYFRQLCKRHLPRYSPEQCWLVIRTFIKGYHLDERNNYLSIEDYQEIPNREKIVSEDDFKNIYNQVWHWYYRYTKENQAWDDQDLIRWVLFHQYYSPDYTAIFCDESQDFTRLELQLIMRLSVFSKYDLEHEFVPSLPFAFAGDPLQTLNPTGFRWASLKATFYNEVLTALSPTGNLNLEMNFQELVCNYRSFPAIVGVSNLIQLWRTHLFELAELEPQTARRIGESSPEKYILGENLSPEEAKLYMQDSLIILPCDETGETDYIRNDQLLKDLFPEINNGSKPWNMLSAITAKGLEFKQVILYKFGDNCPQDIFATSSQNLEKIKYFLNKLYVATSRATEQLFIVDTQKGEQHLWQYASDSNQLQNLIRNHLSHLQKWENKIHLLNWGYTPESLGKDDPYTIAETLMTEGLNNKNSDLLWRAHQAYKRLQQEEQAAVCEAEALKLDGEFIKAGHSFLKQQKLESAWHCFWQGMAWQELLKLYHHFKETEADIDENSWFRIENDYPLIEYMATLSSNPQVSQLDNFTQILKSQLNKEQFKQEILSPQWQNALESYYQQINLFIKNKSQEFYSNCENHAQILEKVSSIITQDRKNKYLKLAGYCYFYSKNYQQAINCWELSKTTNIPEYYRAKAYILGMPKGLEYLVRLGANQEILQAWEKANKPMQPQWLSYVAPVLEANSHYETALQAYCHLNKKDKVHACWKKISSPSLKLISGLISYYIHFQHWEEMITTLESYISQIIQNTNTLFLPFLTRLAASKLTPESLNKQQRQRLETLFQDSIIPLSKPQNYSTYYVGVILEKMGALVLSLQFYENYTGNQTSSKLRKFARQRWLAVKKKQALYFQNQGKNERANNLEKEVKRRAIHWSIPPQEIKLTPPQIRIQQKSSSPIPTEKSFLKYPQEAQVESFPQGIMQLKVRHLDIKVMKKAQQILILDQLSQQTIRIDGLTSQVKVGEMILKPQGKQGLSFVSPSGSFGGNVLYSKEGFKVELKIQGLSEKIEITF